MSLVHEKLALVMKGLSHIPKGRAQGVSYEFRGIDAVFNELHGLLADQGLTLQPEVLDDWQLNMIPGTKDRQQSQALFRVRVSASAEDGSTAVLGVGLAQSHDYGDKAVYQAQQNAVKYVLIEAFAIPTDEPDMDSRPADPVKTDPTPAGWLAENVATLEDWSETARREHYTLAMNYLGYDKLDSMEKAEAVFGHMKATYEEREK